MTPARRTHPAIVEAEEWEDAARRFAGADAQLIAVSRFMPDARVYRAGPRVFKIRRRLHERQTDGNSIDAEAGFLVALGVNAVVKRDERWEVLVRPALSGVPAGFTTADWGLSRRLRLFISVARQLAPLHRRGIAHRDLRPDNILVGSRGTVALIDFDRAAARSTFGAAWDDWMGVGKRPSPYPIWKLGIALLAPRLLSLGRRTARMIPRESEEPRDDTDRALQEGWSLAASSRANSAGQGLAYYALSYGGRLYPGERPWHLRWEAIRQHVDFRGKRVVELGCNMALTSSFCLIYGARAATAVDADPEVLRAATKVASALGVRPDFRRINLDGDRRWEADIGPADVVVAMSILNWVTDKERLLRYIGSCHEVIFEGHEATQVEVSRLTALGFDDIAVICQTERGRDVLHARRISGESAEPVEQAKS